MAYFSLIGWGLLSPTKTLYVGQSESSDSWKDWGLWCTCSNLGQTVMAAQVEWEEMLTIFKIITGKSPFKVLKSIWWSYNKTDMDIYWDTELVGLGTMLQVCRMKTSLFETFLYKYTIQFNHHLIDQKLIASTFLLA